MHSRPTLHHIGFVVESIERRIDSIASSLAATSVAGVFEDPIQRARVTFLELPGPGTIRLELVQPTTPDSPVARFLEKGGGMHHVCYEVDELEAQIRHMKSERAMLIRSPQPAVAFGGRRIAWMRTRDALLVEYLERDRTRSGQEVGDVAR